MKPVLFQFKRCRLIPVLDDGKYVTIASNGKVLFGVRYYTAAVLAMMDWGIPLP